MEKFRLKIFKEFKFAKNVPFLIPIFMFNFSFALTVLSNIVKDSGNADLGYFLTAVSCVAFVSTIFVATNQMIANYNPSVEDDYDYDPLIKAYRQSQINWREDNRHMSHLKNEIPVFMINDIFMAWKMSYVFDGAKGEEVRDQLVSTVENFPKTDEEMEMLIDWISVLLHSSIAEMQVKLGTEINIPDRFDELLKSEDND